MKHLLPVVHMIHSVDTLRLAESIAQHAAGLGHRVPVMLEVNCSGEKQKHGVAVGAAQCLAEQIATMGNIELIGMMTMAPLVDDPDKARPIFTRLREIFEDTVRNGQVGESFAHLSMGMSQDYVVAVEEGATMLRIGTAIFEGT